MKPGVETSLYEGASSFTKETIFSVSINLKISSGVRSFLQTVSKTWIRLDLFFLRQ